MSGRGGCVRECSHESRELAQKANNKFGCILQETPAYRNADSYIVREVACRKSVMKMARLRATEKKYEVRASRGSG